MSGHTVQSLCYRLSVPTYLAARAADRWFPGVLASGWVPGLTAIRTERHPLPGPEWLRLRPLLCGICGSDLAVLTGRSSPALSPFVSFPAVLGHEIVAQVSEVGAAVPGVQPGDRVVVDPFISCTVRGLDPCPSCCRGEPSLCTHAAEGALAPGMLIGYCRDLPGGWSEEMVAHRTQLFRVPPTVPDPLAVLIEPLSVGLHAVLKLPPATGSRVLILGGGTVGLCVLAALRLLARPCHVTVVARYPFQAHLASTLGADGVVLEGPGAGRSVGDAAVQRAGARVYQPLRGRPVYAGGFDWVYDCVGSPDSLDGSLRVAGPRGRVVLVGCAGEIPRLDWSFVWARELHITGSYGYGREPSLEGGPHTFAVALRLVEEHPSYPLADLVTHRFPLARWREAIRVSLRRRQYESVKTVFDGRPDR
ncbi:MAG: alcohol dehydrogenase catalytic domain-containing protein [Chloroflexi bacterium]|nr:alcohol dehydrogenase catalytic domain-containing protein [Chloroflexota bacterium]